MLLFLSFFMCHYCWRVETQLTSVCKSAKVTVELVLDSAVSVSVRTGCVQSYLWSKLKRHYFFIPTKVSFTLFSRLITLTGVFSKMLDTKE